MRTNFAIGVDVGGTRIAVGLVERKGRIVKDVKRLTPKTGPFSVVDAIIDLVEEVSTGGVQPSEIAGIGIGVPAQIDFLRQSIEYCTNLPLAGVDVRSLVMSRTKREVTIDNDGHMAAFGESRFGAAKGARDFLMITVGTGVGGGIFLNGEPYRGSRGLGGEIGHVVVQMDGAPCPCGGKGHLEAYLGRPAIAARGREAAGQLGGAAILKAASGDIEAITAESVLQAAAKGDAVARQILLDAGVVLGRALVGFVNVFNPKLIVVGGGIGESADYMVERAAEVMRAEAMAGRRDVTVTQAVLGNDAGILGAAALAFDEHDMREGLHR
ncbi:MAG: ROK family protein [Coriobacteriia bacterium]|nr:ROK family protein [Coriobacteriia bacterium]